MNTQAQLQALFQQAVTLHQSGRLAEAEPLYRRIIASDPGNFAPRHMLGLAYAQQQRFAEAVEWIGSALALNPDAVMALVHHGGALAALGRHAEALASFDRALAAAPGNALLQAEALTNRGAALRKLGRADEALASYDNALGIAPNNTEAWNNRGNVLASLERFEEALASFDQALAVASGNPETLNNRGNALQGLERYDDALVHHDQALAMWPDYADAWNNRGNALQSLARLEESLSSFDRALAIDPGNAETWNNRGNILVELARFDEAVDCYDRATARNPDYAEAHASKACVLLLRGQFDEGWRLWEWRKKLKKPLGHLATPAPLWLGDQDIRGKRLFIHAEQGLGDTIQFCRYLPLLKQRGAEVIFAPQKPLGRLMQGLGVSISDGAPASFDFHIPLLSLPLAFGTRLETIPAAIPYLWAEPERVMHWKARLGSGGYKVGISWQGKSKGAQMRRSAPLQAFAGLAALDGVRLISLQKGADEIPGFALESMRADFDAGPDAFLDTAAVMQSLDLVITVDTSIAHLAGALGVPAWVALRHVPDWRWLLGRDDTPWYPSLRLFRQASPGDWESVFAAMQQELAGR